MTNRVVSLRKSSARSVATPSVKRIPASVKTAGLGSALIVPTVAFAPTVFDIAYDWRWRDDHDGVKDNWWFYLQSCFHGIGKGTWKELKESVKFESSVAKLANTRLVGRELHFI